MKQDKKELLDSVIKSCNAMDGKKMLSCAKAFQLAQELDVKKLEIAQICNEHSIRICNCQLGCFK